MKKVSVVTPIYGEEANIQRFYATISAVAAAENAYSWEFLFVNDGSRDNSLVLLRELVAGDARCKVIDLSRNFGKEIALTAGVFHATGDAVVCIDADLQHPPAYIPSMLRQWETGAEIVEMIRESMVKESLLRKTCSMVFYFLLRTLSNVQIASRTTDFRLLDRKVVDEFKKIGEKQRMFRGLIDWLGFKKVALSFVAKEREGGQSVYSYGKLFHLAMDSFVSYSSKPLKLIGLLGLFILLASSGLLLWMLAWTLISPHVFSYTPLAIFVVFNTFLIGVVLVSLGLISLYISKIYGETQNRPLFAVREFIGVDRQSADIR